VCAVSVWVGGCMNVHVYQKCCCLLDAVREDGVNEPNHDLLAALL